MIRKIASVRVAAWTAVLSFGLGVSSLSVAQAATVNSAAMKAALVPQANVYFWNDVSASQKAPIQVKLEALRKELEQKNADDEATQNKMLRMEKRMKALSNALGINEEDMSGIVFSLSLEGLSLDKKPDWSQVSALAAISLKKSVTIDKIKLAINQVAAENGMDLLYDRSTYRDQPMLSVVQTEEKPDTKLPRELYVALPEKGEIVYIGNENSVKAALDRLAEKKKSATTAGLEAARKAVPSSAQSFLLFVPSDAIRTKLKELSQNMPQQQNPILAGAIQALGGMKHLVYSAKAENTLDMDITAAFDNAQHAMQMKSMLDMMVLGMGKMMIMQAVGKPIPLLETLKTNQKDTTTGLSFALTEEDLKALMTMKMNGPPHPGAGGVPVPPQMQGVPAPGN